jgi:glyceraldehyde-3-phosphate dehydrogenase (NADP+)
MEAERFIIGNELTASEKITEIKNPYTNETIKKVYKAGKEHIEKALSYLESIFPKYKNTPSYIKASLLEMVSEKVSERKEELAQLITLETGKPVMYSRIELERAVLTFKLGSEEAKRIEGEVLNLDLLKGSENKMGMVRRFPLGIVFAITPWNFPVNLVAHKLSPALASGNVVLLKPASSSLTCGIELVKIIRECCGELKLDFCPVNVVTSSGSETEEFLSDSRVKVVSFTGSSEVGWKIKQKTNIQRVSLELGGNAGVIVDETADIKTAASKIAPGAFAQAGQSCISVQRVFVHEKIYDSFVTALKEEAGKIKFGNPFEDNTIVGPMITLDDAKRVEEWVNEAKEANAKILTGGKRDGAVFEPTIVANTTKEMKVNKDEVFAPLLTLQKFGTVKDAVNYVNDSEYGLQAGIFTKDINNAFYAYNNIEAGGVIVNDVPTYRMDIMPYGGVKKSGNAREGVKYAIEEMTDRKIMVVSL